MLVLARASTSISTSTSTSATTTNNAEDSFRILLICDGPEG
jgi:hypothetical protein